MPPSVAVLRNGRGSFFCSTASSTDLSVPPQAEGAGGDGTGPGTVEGGTSYALFPVWVGFISRDFPSERNSLMLFTGVFLVVRSHGMALKPFTDTLKEREFVMS